MDLVVFRWVVSMSGRKKGTFGSWWRYMLYGVSF